LRSGAYISADSDDVEELIFAPNPLLTSSRVEDTIDLDLDENCVLETAGNETNIKNIANNRKDVEVCSDVKEELMKLKQENDNLKREGANNKKLIELLKDQVECPVCLEVPRELPVAICPNGHVVCKTCKRNLCPKCRAVMGNGKSLLAGTMIKNLEHKCKFDGCHAILAHGRRLLGHFKICEYREVVCPCSGEVVALKNLQSHLLDSPCAPIKVFNCASDSNTQMSGTRKIVFPNYFTVSGMMKVCYFVGIDASFVLQPYRINESFHVRLLMLGSDSDCRKYRVKITVHSSESTPSDADVSFASVVVPDSIDQYKHEDRLKHSKLSVCDIGIETILTSKNNKHHLSVSLLVVKLM